MLFYVVFSGYGHMAPSTFGGRLFCIFYALFGIPLCVLALKSIGERINELLETGFILISSKRQLRGDTTTKVKVMLSTTGLVLVLLLLGGLLYLSEDWSYFEGVYYCFIGIAIAYQSPVFYSTLSGVKNVCVDKTAFATIIRLQTFLSNVVNPFLFSVKYNRLW